MNNGSWAKGSPADRGVGVELDGALAQGGQCNRGDRVKTGKGTDWESRKLCLGCR